MEMCTFFKGRTMSIRLRQSIFVISRDFSTQACGLQERAASHKFRNQGIFIPLDCALRGIEGEWRSFMENNKKVTGRNIIVSDFEVAPYDPEEYEHAGDTKCHGQIIVNKQERTITFRHISGTKPIFFAVLSAMSINKNWFRIFNAEECEKKFKDYMLLFTKCPNTYYIAHTGENGLPVIDKEIENVWRIIMNVEEITLTELEFYLLAQLEHMLYFSMRQFNREKKQFIKFWEFRYIK